MSAHSIGGACKEPLPAPGNRSNERRYRKKRSGNDGGEKGRNGREEGAVTKKAGVVKSRHGWTMYGNPVTSEYILDFKKCPIEGSYKEFGVQGACFFSRRKRSNICSCLEEMRHAKNLPELNRFLASKNIPVAPQPPYSSDLSPCDFFLFPKLKNHLKGHHFGTLENIQTAVTDQLKAIPISEFHQCYEEWKKRLQRCVASEGSYFEGDNVEL
ncbi:putative transposase [Trichonephila clavipes]|nr:putative transposase [Trichonephila clavipes]